LQILIQFVSRHYDNFVIDSFLLIRMSKFRG